MKTVKHLFAALAIILMITGGCSSIIAALIGDGSGSTAASGRSASASGLTISGLSAYRDRYVMAFLRRTESPALSLYAAANITNTTTTAAKINGNLVTLKVWTVPSGRFLNYTGNDKNLTLNIVIFNREVLHDNDDWSPYVVGIGTVEVSFTNGTGSGVFKPVTSAANSQAQSVSPFPRVGIWRVTGRDSVNWTANMVIEEIDVDRFNGYFEWRGGIDYGGREYFRGVYDPQTRKVSIQGYRLENNRGIGLARYEAYLTRDGNDLESGTWGGGATPGTWEGKWQE